MLVLVESFWWNRLDSASAADYNPLARLESEAAANLRVVPSGDSVARAQSRAAMAKI
ncbi:MAG: hypothetical protein NTX87_14505 [Planctomycetota bacterium]|nr:hypothetical protein [Planctomycetota bacterium]